jgi:hypothetical protein
MTTNKILRNLHLLNLALLAVILCFAYYLLFPLTEMPVTYFIPLVKEGALGKKPGTEPPIQQTPNPMDYTLIAEQNLFHPERKIPPEKKAEAPLPKPEFVLYGTLITPDLGIAYLEDKKSAPVTTPGRGKRQTAVKKGESLSGFILKELHNDRVVMIRGEESMIVYLNDPQVPKAREGVPDPTKTAAPPRTSATTSTPARPGTAPAMPEDKSRSVTPPAAASKTGSPPPAAMSGLPSPGAPAAVPGPSGAFTPTTRPRYRPVPSGSYPAPAPAPVPIGPYP